MNVISAVRAKVHWHEFSGPADVVTQTIVGLQADAAPGALASELEPGSGLRTIVHQAAGMLSVQLDLPVVDVLARLRAHAYAQGRPVNDVAQRIINRELRLR